MLPLVIDITPLAINRTAMFFIVRDTVRHIILSGRPVSLQALGEHINIAEFVANDFSLHFTQESRIKESLGKALGKFEHHSDLCSDDNGRVELCINLVFDPLYLLFMNPAVRTIAYVLDLTPVTRPEWHSPQVSRMYAAAFKRLYDPSIDIVSISESTSRDLWANFGIPRHRAHVVPLYERFDHLIGTRPEYFSKQFLFVGSLELRKNVTGLVDGFVRSDLAKQGYSLHIVGGDGHGADSIKRATDGIDGVVLRGRLSDEDLQLEYKRCCALAYPSLWEGFGLPALEALGRGLPLLLSDTGALPEVGGRFAIYADPCNPRSIANGLIELAAYAQKDVNWDPAEFEERKLWLSKFSLDAYLSAVTGVIEHSQTAADEFNTAGEIEPPSSELKTKPDRSGVHIQGSRRRKLLKSRLLHRLRIVPATLRNVPGNSFTLDYLYCLQQERRLRLSRVLSRFMSGKVWMYPWYSAQAVVEALSLYMTNLFVRSMINEIVMQKLAARFEKTND